MDTDNISGELIGSLTLFASLRCSIVETRSCTNTLPLFIGKGCCMLPTKPFVFIHDDSPVITCLVRSIELTTRDGINGINRKQSIIETLAASPIPGSVNGIRDIFCGLALHP